MNRFVLALTGPSGSGKSTVATKLAKELPKCVNIDADHIKHMIPSGFSHEVQSDGSKKWSYHEWELVGDSIGLLATNFQARGFDVIINGYIDEPAWQAIEKHLTLTHKVLLLPELSVTQSRDQERPGDEPMGGDAVQEHHLHFSTDKFFDDFIKMNSTNHSVDETVGEIKKIIV